MMSFNFRNIEAWYNSYDWKSMCTQNRFVIVGVRLRKKSRNRL